jgi:hypothetical protein
MSEGYRRLEFRRKVVYPSSGLWNQAAAREIVLDRIALGDLPPDSANAVFDIAAGAWPLSVLFR